MLLVYYNLLYIQISVSLSFIICAVTKLRPKVSYKQTIPHQADELHPRRNPSLMDRQIEKDIGVEVARRLYDPVIIHHQRQYLANEHISHSHPSRYIQQIFATGLSLGSVPTSCHSCRYRSDLQLCHDFKLARHKTVLPTCKLKPFSRLFEITQRNHHRTAMQSHTSSEPKISCSTDDLGGRD